MYGFCPLASGSKGNVLYLGTAHTKILVDAGISGKGIRERLQEIDVALEEIQAILITHEHHDHIVGLRTLAFKFGIPIITNSLTAKAIIDAFHDCPKFKLFTTNEPFEFQDLEIMPFSIKHDAVDPVGFTIKTMQRKIGIATDLGIVTPSVKHHLQNCHILHVEANHDPQLVHASSRPPIYKERVLGPTGHLSNQASAELLDHCYNPHLAQVYLAHLSSECNRPELALSTVTDHLQKSGKTLQISIAHQEVRSKATIFEESVVSVL